MRNIHLTPLFVHESRVRSKYCRIANKFDSSTQWVYFTTFVHLFCVLCCFSPLSMLITHYNVPHWCSNEVERFAPFATIWLLLIQTDWSKEPANKANYSCVLCVRWRIVHAQCSLGSQWKSRTLCAAEQKWHRLLTLFNSCLQVPFMVGLALRSSRFLCEKLPPKAIVRAVSQCSLFQWLSEGIKWNFINKGCNCLVRCGGEAFSMSGFVSSSGPFQCHVCTSPCDAFASACRGIP